MTRTLLLLSVAVGLATIASADSPKPADAKPQMTTGNGEANWIMADGVKRKGSTFTFREVKIEEDGWLVLHPFRDGKPYGQIYVGSTFLEGGRHENVEISVPVEPETGKMFLVMLHSDVNKNKEFDFVFVDERNVLDKAVFEGMTMIAHPFATP